MILLLTKNKNLPGHVGVNELPPVEFLGIIGCFTLWMKFGVS